MKRQFDFIDLSAVETYSIKGRTSKVSVDDLGKEAKAGTSFSDFMDTLPNIRM